jgi:hypothetical protein
MVVPMQLADPCDRSSLSRDFHVTELNVQPEWMTSLTTDDAQVPCDTTQVDGAGDYAQAT